MRQSELFNKNVFAGLLILFYIMISPTQIQSISIEIENLEEIVTSSLDRLIGEIDPTLEKSQNLSTEFLISFEERMKKHLTDTFYWLQVNLFVLLFGTVIMSIVIMVLLLFLDIILIRYEFKAEKRRFIGLTVITIIALWLFVAIAVSIWPSSSLSDLETLEYILFGLVTALVLYLICVWIFSLYKIRHRLYRATLETCGCKSYTRVAIQSQSQRQAYDLELKPATF